MGVVIKIPGMRKNTRKRIHTLHGPGKECEPFPPGRMFRKNV
jgi:hypothetical protein